MTYTNIWGENVQFWGEKDKKVYFRHKKLLPGVRSGRREERVCRVLHMHELGGQELAVGGLCVDDVDAGG